MSKLAARMNCKQPVEELLADIGSNRKQKQSWERKIPCLPPTAFKSLSTISLLLESNKKPDAKECCGSQSPSPRITKWSLEGELEAKKQ